MTVPEVSTAPTAVAWAARAWGRDVVAAQPLAGGWTSTMLRLTAADGDEAVLRVLTRDPWRRHGRGLLTRESEVQHLLTGTAVPAPASLAVEATGADAGDPAHLMSLLPGALELRRCDDALLGTLAALLADVHAVDPDARPREYQSWAPPAKRQVPPWAARPGLWEAAFEVLALPRPPYRGAFLHRDFHLGNVLWQDGAVTGVVDWVETSWGPAELDVAHAATYLAMLHGPDSAAAFVERCLPGPLDDARRHWHVMDVVGYLPDPVKVAQPWRAQGVDVSDDLARARLEQRLADVLAG
jgi:aminoglycoside phosphotransferase (APT) family kinase protein